MASAFETGGVVLRALRSRWLGRALVMLALALLAALVVRFQAGYIPRFFTVSLPVSLAVFATSLAIFLAEPTRRQACVFLLCMAAALAVFIGAAPAIVTSTAARIYLSQEAAQTRVVRHSLPHEPALFRDGFDKTRLSSLSDLARWGARFEQRWRADLLATGLKEGEARAASMMLFTSTLWAHGNARQPRREGCIAVNEENNWQHQRPTLEVVKAARIGCCVDYAHALSLILSKNGIENRYLSIPGHIFNEARIDGKWYVLDANTNVIIDSAWNEALDDPDEVTIHVFPHPGSQSGKLRRESLAAFQNYLVNVVLLGDFPAGVVEQGRDPDPEYRQAIDILY
jgi:hypothetical protein